MANENHRTDNTINYTYQEQKNIYKNFLKKQYCEVELWKMKIEGISKLKNQEKYVKDEKTNEMKLLQNKVYKKRMENCHYIHTLLRNNWLSDLENSLKVSEKDSKSKTTIILNQLKEEINSIKFLADGVILKKQQDDKLNELRDEIKEIEHSINLLNETTIKIGLEMLL